MNLSRCEETIDLAVMPSGERVEFRCSKRSGHKDFKHTTAIGGETAPLDGQQWMWNSDWALDLRTLREYRRPGAPLRQWAEPTWGLV